MKTSMHIALAAFAIMWATSAWAIPMGGTLNDPSVAGNCGVARPAETGCDIPTCQSCVCGIDPFCCGGPVIMSSQIDGLDFCDGLSCWDPLCVGEAGNECATACEESSSQFAPTLSPWGLALAAFILIGVGYQALRRRSAVESFGG